MTVPNGVSVKTMISMRMAMHPCIQTRWICTCSSREQCCHPADSSFLVLSLVVLVTADWQFLIPHIALFSSNVNTTQMSFVVWHCLLLVPTVDDSDVVLFYFQITHCSLQGLLCNLGSTFQLPPPGVSTRVTTQRRKVELWARNVREFCLNSDFHVTFRDLLHAVKLRHGTDGSTSPPKEGVLRIFSP